MRNFLIEQMLEGVYVGQKLYRDIFSRLFTFICSGLLAISSLWGVLELLRSNPLRKISSWSDRSVELRKAAKTERKCFRLIAVVK